MPTLRTTSHESGNVPPPGSTSKQAHQALELTLHDGLDRLEEFVLLLAFQSSGSQFEILSISPPPAPARTTRPHRKTENVICLHETRLKKTA